MSVAGPVAIVVATELERHAQIGVDDHRQRRLGLERAEVLIASEACRVGGDGERLGRKGRRRQRILVADALRAGQRFVATGRRSREGDAGSSQPTAGHSLPTHDEQVDLPVEVSAFSARSARTLCGTTWQACGRVCAAQERSRLRGGCFARGSRCAFALRAALSLLPVSHSAGELANRWRSSRSIEVGAACASQRL